MNELISAQVPMKFYTEGLGRVPSYDEIFSQHTNLRSMGCSAQVLRMLHSVFLLGPEFESKGYTEREKVQAAYRVILNRDPDEGGWNYWSTIPFEDTVEQLGQSQEFLNIVDQICAANGGTYGWNGTPLDGTSQSDTDLRSQLAAAQPGSVVMFSGRIRVSSPLTIPEGVILRGYGGSGNYLKYGTLLRENAFDNPMVILEEGACIENCTIDGRLADLTFTGNAVNVEVRGSNTTIRNVRSQNAAGWTNVFVSPHHGELTNVKIYGLDVMGYAGRRQEDPFEPYWNDGVSFAGKSGFIKDSNFVDLTDVSIIVFDPNRLGTEVEVENNRAFNVGNNAWGMIGIDQLNHPGITPPTDFSGTIFKSNEVYTVGYANARVGILDGASAWGNQSDGTPRFDIDFGATYEGNRGFVRFELYGVLTDTIGYELSDFQESNPEFSFLNIPNQSFADGCSPAYFASRQESTTDACLVNYS